jgi:hypothetical protein
VITVPLVLLENKVRQALVEHRAQLVLLESKVKRVPEVYRE